MEHSIDIQNLKSLITFMHLSGLALGVGSVWILDIVIFKCFKDRKIHSEFYFLFGFLSNFITTGLAILWLSGLLFIVYYYYFDPEYLYNQKVWAKTIIVTILTANGYCIHAFITPKIKANKSENFILSASLKEQHLFLTIGVISFVSWLFPTALGVLRSLNFSVDAPTITTFYLSVLLSIIFISNIAISPILRSLNSRESNI